MSFKPLKANVRNGFVRNPNASTFKNYQTDVVLDITKYDGDKIIGINPSNNESYQVEIAEDTKKYLAGNAEARKKAADAPYNGRVIDKALKEKIPVGSRIVVERFESSGPARKEGNSTIRIGTGYQVWRSPAPQKEKCFAGVFTASEYDRQLNTVNHWGDVGYNVKNEKILNAFAKRLDTVHKEQLEVAEYNAKRSEDDKAKFAVQVRCGFQLRAGTYVKQKNERTNADETVFQVFNYTPNADTQSVAPEGLSYALQVTGKDFLDYIEDYNYYLKNTATLPDRVKREDVEVEFTTYKIYRITSTGNNIKAFQIRDFGSGEFSHQAASLLNRKTYMSLEEDEVPAVHSHNYAVRGALILSSDSEDPVSGEKIPRNLVGHFFARGVRGIPTSLIGSTHDGEVVRTVVVERLKPLNDEQFTSGSATASKAHHVTKSHAPEHPPVDAPQEPDVSAPAVVAEVSVEDDDIPF